MGHGEPTAFAYPSLMTSARGTVLAAIVALSLALVAVPTAHAAVVPVDPGPSVEGRPVWGTTQNLPPMMGTGMYFAGPQNAQAIEEYYDSGQARRDQLSIAQAAREWIYAWVDDRCGGRPQSCDATVVFDVDETLLSNYEFYKGTGFTFDQAAWNAFNEACQNTAIAPARNLYRTLVRDGFSVVLITGRAEADRSWTSACLRKRGISGWDELMLRTPAEASLTADDFKSQRRSDLQREGHRIVASIGDQVSDMSKGHLKAGFLLPNIMYFIP
ncbi:MAG: hypothetical protein RLZ94_1439 [Actinomycetota bacterium]|jgi:hypothetical protein